mmetsp:Transcript_21184/g.19295  ORF Transcript_21184/g.19295 Transcript_21184/m.19295 type:complete len:139 (+) Transcript_21184:56-472(+)
MESVKNDSTEERLDYYFNQALPNSLLNLNQKNDTITQIISQLESNYQSAGNDITKQFKAKENAKRYLTETLINIATDLNTVAVSIDQCIDLQTQAVDTIASDINLFQQRMLISKEGLVRNRYLQLLGDSPKESNWITK